MNFTFDYKNRLQKSNKTAIRTVSSMIGDHSTQTIRSRSQIKTVMTTLRCCTLIGRDGSNRNRNGNGKG